MDVYFDVNGMYVVLNGSIVVENNVKANTDELEKVAGALKTEISSFVSHGKSSAEIIQAQVCQVRGMIATIDQKIASAESKRQSEISTPTRPYVSPDTPPYVKDAMMADYQKNVNQVSAQNAKIREQNQRISNYIVQCNQAKGQLNLIIGQMLGVQTHLKNEASSTASAAKELCESASSNAKEGSAIYSAMGDFYDAFNQVYQAAGAIENFSASSVKGSVSSREFRIKNTHTHTSASAGARYNFSGEQESTSNTSSVNNYESTGEILIKSKDEASFFENIQNAEKVKMPSANLHKLGGKVFIAKMNELGYIAVMQENGTIIDLDGKIHWERGN